MLKFGDLIRETTATTGTGAYSLGGSPAGGFFPFSTVMTNGDTCYYEVSDGTDRETGLGTYVSTSNDLQRTNIHTSTNGGAEVNWGAGDKAIRMSPTQDWFSNQVFIVDASRPIAGMLKVEKSGEQMRLGPSDSVYTSFSVDGSGRLVVSSTGNRTFYDDILTVRDGTNLFDILLSGGEWFFQEDSTADPKVYAAINFRTKGPVDLKFGTQQNTRITIDGSTGRVTIHNGLTLDAKFVTHTETNDGNSGAAKTINWTAGVHHKLTLTANTTLTFTDPTTTTGKVSALTLIVKQDATGNRTVTWPASVDWGSAGAPVLSTAASKVDIVQFLWNKADAKYYGSYQLGFS